MRINLYDLYNEEFHMMDKFIGLCECGYTEDAPFGLPDTTVRNSCPNCRFYKGRWTIIQESFVSDAKWWNPLTWGNGHWEEIRRIKLHGKSRKAKQSN